MLTLHPFLLCSLTDHLQLWHPTSQPHQSSPQVPARVKPTDAHLLSCSLLLRLQVVATLPAILQLLTQATAVSLTLLRLLLQILNLSLQCLDSTAQVDTLPACLQWTLTSTAVPPASAPSPEHAPAHTIKEQTQCCRQPPTPWCRGVRVVMPVQLWVFVYTCSASLVQDSLMLPQPLQAHLEPVAPGIRIQRTLAPAAHNFGWPSWRKAVKVSRHLIHPVGEVQGCLHTWLVLQLFQPEGCLTVHAEAVHILDGLWPAVGCHEPSSSLGPWLMHTDTSAPNRPVTNPHGQTLQQKPCSGSRSKQPRA